jgi:hypothetical protein
VEVLQFSLPDIEAFFRYANTPQGGELTVVYGLSWEQTTYTGYLPEGSRCVTNLGSEAMNAARVLSLDKFSAALHLISRISERAIDYDSVLTSVSILAQRHRSPDEFQEALSALEGLITHLAERRNYDETVQWGIPTVHEASPTLLDLEKNLLALQDLVVKLCADPVFHWDKIEPNKSGGCYRDWKERAAHTFARLVSHAISLSQRGIAYTVDMKEEQGHTETYPATSWSYCVIGDVEEYVIDSPQTVNLLPVQT